MVKLTLGLCRHHCPAQEDGLQGRGRGRRRIGFQVNARLIVIVCFNAVQTTPKLKFFSNNTL